MMGNVAAPVSPVAIENALALLSVLASPEATKALLSDIGAKISDLKVAHASATKATEEYQAEQLKARQARADSEAASVAAADAVCKANELTAKVKAQNLMSQTKAQALAEQEKALADDKARFLTVVAEFETDAESRTTDLNARTAQLEAAELDYKQRIEALRVLAG